MIEDKNREYSISVICVYNDKQRMNEQLKKTLSDQACTYDFVPVNNVNNQFKSAAEALNFGALKAKGDILVFAHQDIIFKTQNELSLFAKYIADYPVGTILGVAGAVEGRKENIGIYTSGEKYDPRLLTTVSAPIQVSCVDEFLFGMRKETYIRHDFDEKLCNSWHLYAVELCLYNRKNGGAVYVVPVNVHHFSKGKINLKYMDGLVELSDKYRKDFKRIWTTCYKINTNYIYVRLLREIWAFKKKVFRENY